MRRSRWRGRRSASPSTRSDPSMGYPHLPDASAIGASAAVTASSVTKMAISRVFIGLSFRFVDCPRSPIGRAAFAWPLWQYYGAAKTVGGWPKERYHRSLGLSSLQFRLLGPLEIVADGRALRLKAAKQKTILALLLLHRGEVVSVDLLQEALWGDHPPPTAATALQGYVSQLRRLLEAGEVGGASLLVTRSPGYLLAALPEQVDFARFEQLVESGRDALATGEPGRAAALIAEGLALWRGPPLADFSYEQWAQSPIGRLDEQRLAALEDRIEADLAAGRHGELVGELESLIAEQPLRERLRSQLMLALYRGGRQAEALEAYQAARRALVEELGIEPSPELQRLNHSILNQDEVLIAPPLAALDRGAIVIPRPATPLVGRERELQELVELLTTGGVRLLTLTGPGGVGKTRVAVELALRAADDYSGGVCFVDLSAVRDPVLVLPAVEEAVEPDDVGEAVAETCGADRLAGHIGERKLLVVIDNLEQAIEAAPELAALVASCPNLKLLVTSRELLRVQGETDYPVPPLAEAEAVRLFCQRAQMETTEEIAELCRHLDNLPLAVELAAARAKALSPKQILARLPQRLDLLSGGRDADPRQRTLRATIAWSYDLLSGEEQVLFRRLAIFSGGCTLEAVEKVCDGDLDALQSLVEKSLLRFSNERYSMLETIREYAADMLQQSEEQAAAAERHADFFLEFAEREGTELHTFRGSESQDRIEAERPNLRAALAELVTSGQGESALRLLGSLWVFWFVRGYLHEGRRLSELALSAHPQGAPPQRVDALWGAAKFSLFLGDLDDAASRAEELLALAEDCEIPRGIAVGTEIRAMVALERGDLQRARALFAQSAELARETRDSFLLGSVANNFGDLELREGNFEAARELFEESLAVGRAQGDQLRILTSLANLGMARIELGELQQARSDLINSLKMAVALGYVDAAAYALLGLGLAERDPRRAVVLIGASDSIFEHVDTPILEYEGGLRQRRLSSICAEIGDEASAKLLLEGRGMPLNDAVEYALVPRENNPSAGGRGI
jgi:predicted ATPase/DNA-binding SARP family transcriptional activator